MSVANDCDLSEYLYDKQPVIGGHFLLSEEMVEIEFMQAVDEGHKQNKLGITFGNDGVIEFWKKM